MKSSSHRTSFLSLLLIGFLLVAPSLSLTDEEYTATIKTTVETHLGDKKAKIKFNCPADGTEPEKIVGCSVCIKGVSAATLDYSLEFRSPQETSKLVASNIDIKDPDEDFDIKHYVAAFVKSCELILSDAQILETIKKTLEAVAETLALKLNQDNAANKEYILLLDETADKRSNSAISVKIDTEKLSMTFKTNFFENTYSLSMRHSLFVEAEVKRAVPQMKADLMRMKKLLGNDSETKATLITMTCANLLAGDFIATQIAARLEPLTWTVAAAEADFTITAGEKTFVFACSESSLDGKIGIVKWVLTYADKKTMSQAFLKTSMYDISALVEAYIGDLITFLIRFNSPTNPEEAIDFGKTPLVEGDGGEGGTPAAERRLIINNDSGLKSERLKGPEGKSVKTKGNKRA
jgi:hypothetical protein